MLANDARPTLEAVTTRPGTEEEWETYSAAWSTYVMGGVVIGPVAGAAFMTATLMTIGYFVNGEWPVWLMVLQTVAVTLAAVAVRGYVKRRKATEVVNTIAEKLGKAGEAQLQDAVASAEAHYGVTGLDVDTIDFEVGKAREVRVVKDGEPLIVRAVFPATDAPLTLKQGTQELPAA